MKVLRHCFVPVSALLLSGCGWVDSSGRQENRSPELAELTQTVSEEALHVSLGSADEDGNLVSVDVTLLAEGGELVAACIAAGGVLAGVAEADFAQTITEACDPAEQSCEVAVDAELTASKVEVSTPKIRRPVAQQYELKLEDSDGATAEQVLTLCIASVSSAPSGQTDVFNVEYNEVTDFIGMEFNASCGPQVASGVLANDTDDFDFSEDEPNLQRCLIAQLVSGPAHASEFVLNEDGGFRYGSGTSLPIGSTDTFSYRVWDGVNESDVVTVTLHVTGENNPPVALNPVRIFDEDTALVLSAADLATDSEGGVLTLVSVGEPVASPAIGLREFDVSPAEIRYTPLANEFGTDSFIYQISDAGGASAVGTVSITVESVNDLPVVTPENSTLSLAVAPATDTLHFTVSDLENTLDGLSISVSSNNESAVTVAESQSGNDGDADNWQVDFAGVADGTADVTLVVEDADGGVSTAVVVVTVGTGVVTTPPVIESPALVATAGLPAVYVIGTDGLATDNESAANTLIIVSPLSVSTGESASINGDQKGFSFTPDAAGTSVVTLTIQDPDGLQATGTLTVTVGAQQPPIIGSPVLTATVGVAKSLSITGDALAADADTDDTELVFSSAPTALPIETIVLDGDNKGFSFTPTAAGNIVITLEVVDPQGNSDTGTITVVVSAPQQPPVVENPALSGVAGVLSSLSLSGDGLVSDADGNVTDLVIDGVPTVNTGELVTVDGDKKGFSFTPTAAGSSVVTLVVEDLDGNSATGALTVGVTALPAIETPALVATVGLEKTLSIDADGLASDPDTLTTDLIFFAAPTSVPVEVITMAGDAKSFSFTPTVAGTTVVSLSVRDPDGNEALGTVTVVVSN